MKTRRLSFVFIRFSESGLFNGLRPIQMEKIWCYLTVCAIRLNSTSTPRRCPGAGRIRLIGTIITHNSGFGKKMFGSYGFRPVRSGVRIEEPICQPGVKIPDPDWSRTEPSHAE
jgi:hypothetical protein